MKFAICNETFYDAQWPQERIFDFAAECGYQGVEIAPFTLTKDIAKFPATERDRLRGAAEAAGIEICGLHWILSKTEGLHLTTPDADVRKRTVVYLKELAYLCRDLGGDVMIFGSPMQRNRPDSISLAQAYANAVEVLKAAAPVLEETGVTLAMEPLAPVETNFLLDVDNVLRLTDSIDSPRVTAMLDCKAMWATEPEPIANVVRRYQGKFCHFHANDPNLQGPGFGELDFVPIFKALSEVKFDRWVSVEVFDYSPGPEKLAKDSLEYMKACLAKAG